MKKMQELEFGEWVAQKREAQGMNKNQLAVAVGTSWGYITKVESGEVNPTLSMMLAISKELGYPRLWTSLKQCGI